MGLKLFHITEYAQSVLLVTSLWLSLVGNWALWRALFKLPEFSTSTPWGLLITLALMVMCVICLLLSVLNWHFTLKPTITLVLLLAAFNTHLLLTQDGFVDSHLLQRMAQDPREVLRDLSSWRLFFTVSVLGFAPAIWLWRTSIRRVALMPNFLQNICLLGLLGAVLCGLWLSQRQALSALLVSQPRLLEWINPVNSLLSLTPRA
jgi:lipid A ethanolaminephosphotransferase